MVALALLGILAAGFEWPGALEADARDLAATDDAQRLRAVERLAMRDATRTKLLLLPMLADRDPSVRLTAARVLARAGAAAATDAATRWITAQGSRDRLLGLQVLRDALTLPAPARRATERALADADAAVRVQALDVLARRELGSSFTAVVAAIDDDNREVRLRAIRLLADARDGRAAVPLLVRLSDADRQVRIEALHALGAVGDPRVAPALLRQLAEATDDVRVAAIDALAQLQVAAAVPPLTALARRRPSDDLARHAQLALGDIATPAAIEAVVAITRDPPTTDELKEALRRAGARAVPVLTRELEAGTPTSAAVAAWALGAIGDRHATGALSAALERPTGVVPAALAALTALADPASVPALVRSAGSPSADVRRLALEALTAIGDDRAVVVLPHALADADASARAQAIRLATAVDASGAAPLLGQRLEDGEAEVRRQAATALARLATPSTDTVIRIARALSAARARGDAELQALGDALERAVGPDDARLLEQALRGATGDARAPLTRGLAAAYAQRPPEAAAIIDTLLALIDEGGAAALAACDALAWARVPPAREAALARAFGDAEPSVQARLAAALASGPGAADQLTALLGSDALPDEVRAALAWAAAGVPAAREALRHAAADAAPPVAANARAALAVGGEPARPRRGWTAVRLLAPDGTPWPARWVIVTAPAGIEVWTTTDSAGRARVAGLPPGPYQVRLADPTLSALPTD